MSTGNPQQGIKITLDDLAKVQIADSTVTPIAQPAPGSRSYGTINEASGQAPAVEHERGNLLLQGWFYLGAAGLVGALIGWAICEPGFVDDAKGVHWGNLIIMPVLVAMMTLGFGIAESLVERSMKKALIRSALALPLGAILGLIFYFTANIVFNIGLGLCAAMGVQSFRSPAFWIARAFAWTIFGVAGGIVYGIVGQSYKKGKFGVLGGVLGAGIGGLLFDPIMIWTGGASAALSRAVGFAIFGLATGAMMGLVESALKDRWFYVTSGPLAGKQFILYKPRTLIGSDQQSDIYLFKDPTILPTHAILEASGARMTLRAAGPVFISGSPISSKVLLDGDLVQIGRYTFRYKERARS
jgi:hypothetical protein